ncbi:MAG: hypothetical protein R3C11_16330 [Planctomycetaceae bacterium]
MQELARLHNQKHLKITSSMYQQWLVAFLETGRIIDREWSPEIQSAWIEVLSYGINFMLQRYYGYFKFTETV